MIDLIPWIDMIDLILWIAQITEAIGEIGLIMIFWIATSLCAIKQPERPNR